MKPIEKALLVIFWWKRGKLSLRQDVLPLIPLLILGLAGGIVAALLVGKPLDQLVGAMVVTAILTCLVGAVLGGMQAVYLRQLLARPIWWVVATVAGVGIGLAVGVVLIEQVGTLISGHRPHIVLVLASGLAFGALTSRPLRHAA